MLAADEQLTHHSTTSANGCCRVCQSPMEFCATVKLWRHRPNELPVVIIQRCQMDELELS